MVMVRRTNESAASNVHSLLHRCLSKVLGPAPSNAWRERFLQQASLLAPELPAETLDGLASCWAGEGSSMNPEQAAQSAVLWACCGGIDH
jgi:hypothetical protein